jgi:hypothetical protein
VNRFRSSTGRDCSTGLLVAGRTRAALSTIRRAERILDTGVETESETN